jgi:hypothetical protein
MKVGLPGFFTSAPFEVDFLDQVNVNLQIPCPGNLEVSISSLSK